MEDGPEILNWDGDDPLLDDQQSDLSSISHPAETHYLSLEGEENGQNADESRIADSSSRENQDGDLVAYTRRAEDTDFRRGGSAVEYPIHDAHHRFEPPKKLTLPQAINHSDVEV